MLVELAHWMVVSTALYLVVRWAESMVDWMAVLSAALMAALMDVYLAA